MVEFKRLINKLLSLKKISYNWIGLKSGEFEFSIRADGKLRSYWPKTTNPELLSSQLRGHWLRKHDTDSKKNRLELPIFISKSTYGKLKLTIDREELPNYLNLSLKKCYQLTEGFYLPENKIINKPRTKIDYKILAGEYKLLIV